MVGERERPSSEARIVNLYSCRETCRYSHEPQFTPKLFVFNATPARPVSENLNGAMPLLSPESFSVSRDSCMVVLVTSQAWILRHTHSTVTRWEERCPRGFPFSSGTGCCIRRIRVPVRVDTRSVRIW